MSWYLKVLRQYADFKGRARRKEYWMFSFINFVILMGLEILLFATTNINDIGNSVWSVSNVFIIVYQLAILIPSIAVGVRRMHDVGKSGWFLLIPIYSFILTVTEGEIENNEYGANPKGITLSSDTY